MTREQIYSAEYDRAYNAVMAAHGAGYHLPYSNLHSDDPEWQGYEDGFHAACRALEIDRALVRSGLRFDDARRNVA